MRNARPLTTTLGTLAMLAAAVTAQAQTTHVVTVSDNSFSPNQLQIATGDTVRWVNAAGGNSHNVTSGNGAFDSSPTASSFTFEVTFNTPGEYPYECTIHQGMSGNITVVGAASPDVELVSVNALDSGETIVTRRAGTAGPKAIRQGDPLTIEALIRNNGGSASEGFDIGYYASPDATITSGDFLLGQAQVPSVAGGAMVNRSDVVQVPGNLGPGDWFIGAIVFLDDPVPANNTAVDNTPVTIEPPFLINAGLNDAWVIPGIGRQGILIAVLPVAEIFFAAWFTYDTERPPGDATAILGEPGHRWITLQGDWVGDTADLQVFVTAGGVFASPTPVPDPAVPIGTMTIKFHDCRTATMSYQIPDLGLDESFPINRLVTDNVPLCEEIVQGMQAGN